MTVEQSGESTWHIGMLLAEDLSGTYNLERLFGF